MSLSAIEVNQVKFKGNHSEFNIWKQLQRIVRLAGCTGFVTKESKPVQQAHATLGVKPGSLLTC